MILNNKFLEQLAAFITRYEDETGKLVGVEVIIDEKVFVFNGEKFQETKRS